jgi:hypothetical protein
MAIINNPTHEAAAFVVFGSDNPIAPKSSNTPVKTTQNPGCGKTGGTIAEYVAVRTKWPIDETANGMATRIRRQLCVAPNCRNRPRASRKNETNTNASTTVEIKYCVRKFLDESSLSPRKARTHELAE